MAWLGLAWLNLFSVRVSPGGAGVVRLASCRSLSVPPEWSSSKGLTGPGPGPEAGPEAGQSGVPSLGAFLRDIWWLPAARCPLPQCRALLFSSSTAHQSVSGNLEPFVSGQLGRKVYGKDWFPGM